MGGVGRLDQPQPATASDGTVYVDSAWRLQAYTPGGRLKWTFFEDGTNVLTEPGVGPDGVVYIAQNSANLYAVNPDGTQRWHVVDPGIIERGPVVDLGNTLMVVGGVPNYGQPGFIKGYSISAELLWQVDLPKEQSENIVPYSCARLSADGSVAYVGTASLGFGQEEFSYLYAIATTP